MNRPRMHPPGTTDRLIGTCRAFAIGWALRHIMVRTTCHPCQVTDRLGGTWCNSVDDAPFPARFGGMFVFMPGTRMWGDKFGDLAPHDGQERQTDSFWCRIARPAKLRHSREPDRSSGKEP